MVASVTVWPFIAGKLRDPDRVGTLVIIPLLRLAFLLAALASLC